MRFSQFSATHLPDVHTNIFEKVLDLWFSLFCFYKNTAGLWLCWNTEFRETWIYIPRPGSLIFSSRINYLFCSFERKAVSFINSLMSRTQEGLEKKSLTKKKGDICSKKGGQMLQIDISQKITQMALKLSLPRLSQKSLSSNFPLWYPIL